jgi:hypothetical protein
MTSPKNWFTGVLVNFKVQKSTDPAFEHFQHRVGKGKIAERATKKRKVIKLPWRAKPIAASDIVQR